MKQIKVVLGYLHYKSSVVRYWTKDHNCTHALETDESIGANVIRCRTKEESREKANNGLKNKEYGNVYVYRENGYFYGYTVHYPRFKSEKNGFINFHCIKSFEKILSKDHEAIYRRVRKW